jgi:hypothetical protein
MCVAVVVEAETPKQHELWQMDSHNPHGAGVAWCDGDIIRYRKGLTWKQVQELGDSLPRPWLLHFRWATHGGKLPRLTHPFPLGHKALSNFKLSGSAEAVLIHTGTWSDYKRHVPSKFRKVDLSDTAIAAYVAGTKGEEILDSVSWATAVMRAAGEGRVDITLRGEWETHEGNSYSNLYWQGRASRYFDDENWWRKPFAFGRANGNSDWIPEISKRESVTIPIETATHEEPCESCGERWFYYHKCRVSGETLISD